MIDEKKIKAYGRAVMMRILADRETKKRMEREVLAMVRDRVFDSGRNDPYEFLGDPSVFAREYLDEMRTIYPKARYIGGGGGRTTGRSYGYEYTSKTTVMGIPLVHINTRPLGLAKGIIAIGSVAVGVISLGGISLGVISLGGISLALSLSLGGVSASLWVAFGGLAVALYMAVGGLAIAYDIAIGGAALAKNYALGGFASARVAIGGEARGIIAVYYQKGLGDYLLRLPATAHQIVGFITSKTEGISGLFEWIIRLLF